MSEKILITGGSGLIGTRLSEMLIEEGYDIAHLSRDADKFSKYQTFEWDVKKEYVDPNALKYADHIIHLAGANLSEGKWTDERKKEIRDSRVFGTRLLAECLKNTPNHVKSFISNSAIGIYGNTGDILISEESNFGDDFLAEVCKEWEQAAFDVKALGIRTVIYRVGIVLSDKGGALPQMAKPIKIMAGAPLGSGKQYMSWIHIDDLCRLYIKAIEEPQYEGIYNAVTPHPVTNEVFTKILAEKMHRPLVLPHVPAFAINLVLGEMSYVVLGGSRVSPNKIMHQGFTFEYSYLDEALDSFYNKD